MSKDLQARRLLFHAHKNGIDCFERNNRIEKFFAGYASELHYARVDLAHCTGNFLT